MYAPTAEGITLYYSCAPKGWQPEKKRGVNELFGFKQKSYLPGPRASQHHGR